MSVDARRLATVISPLRRALLAAARDQEDLPDIPDSQVEIVRALPRGAVAAPSEIAASLGLSRSAVSNLLAAMERSGLVRRRARNDDKRGVEVMATEEALGYFDRFDRASAAIVASSVATLSPSDRTALAAAIPVLERLRDALAVQSPHESR